METLPVSTLGFSSVVRIIYCQIVRLFVAKMATISIYWARFNI